MSLPFKTAYGPRKRVKQHIGEGSHVQQNAKDECDINRIMSKYQKTGVLTHVSRYAGEYGDFSGSPDYQTSMNRLIAANEMFMTLPSSIRDKFGNDPAKFIKFATDDKNIEEMREMGLAPRPSPEPPPTKVQVVNPEPPKDAQ